MRPDFAVHETWFHRTLWATTAPALALYVLCFIWIPITLDDFTHQSIFLLALTLLGKTFYTNSPFYVLFRALWIQHLNSNIIIIFRLLTLLIRKWYLLSVCKFHECIAQILAFVFIAIMFSHMFSKVFNECWLI